MSASLTISELSLYPVKSAAGIAMQALELGRLGPSWDRRWMLVDESGQFVTQRQIPKMALIQTKLIEDGVSLLIPNQPAIEVLISDCLSFDSKQVTVWADEVEAIDCGNVVAKALSGYLGRSLRLVFMPDSTQRLIDPAYDKASQSVSFADGFPLLLISQASLDRFNEQLEQPIGMSHFRPNMVVTGCEAFEEDNWRSFSAGDIHFDVVKPCSRCVIPSIDPLTGKKDSRILKALAASRRIFTDSGDHAAYFGQNVIARGEGLIRCGDRVMNLTLT